MNFGQVQAAVISLVERDNIESKVPRLVNKAIKRLSRLCFEFQVTEYNLNTVAYQEYSSLPDDFIKEHRWSIIDPNGTWIEKAKYSEIKSHHITAAGTYSLPHRYCIKGNNIYWADIPDDAYTFILHYYAGVDDLVDTGDTNVFLTKMWDVVIEWSLEELWTHFGNDQEALKHYQRGLRDIRDIRHHEGVNMALGRVAWQEL